jgi:hypothetical protein
MYVAVDKSRHDVKAFGIYNFISAKSVRLSDCRNKAARYGNVSLYKTAGKNVRNSAAPNQKIRVYSSGGGVDQFF